MKLVRFGAKGSEKPGLVDGAGHIRDLSGHVGDIVGEVLAPDRLRRLAGIDPQTLPLVETPGRLGPPVAGVGKILAIGLNYREHAEETGASVRSDPMLFSKAITSLSGPNDPIVLPRTSEKTDWEVELAVIIGSRAAYVDEDKALDVIAGYAVINDVSERAFQKERGGQFIKGKSADSFGPLGPWLVTRDEIADPQNLALWCDLNGERRQDSNTARMIFPVAYLVSHISQFMTLLPGDVIATGTPAGVGMGCKPPRYLRAGDVLDCGVEALGRQHHEVIAFEEAR
ncbi:MAG: fumarylacetoacetate hydrolase family protein [Rhodospirillales bacterium]|jgi:2-keto-4-pentenoate hydratase/2-oxohepta-3-ene-1,7-dioic acid hydratase in catechol pathway|nr:fumarylacetoacetate hydrolase family protein [Rhodospirillales bacterium]